MGLDFFSGVFFSDLRFFLELESFFLLLEALFHSPSPLLLSSSSELELVSDKLNSSLYDLTLRVLSECFLGDLSDIFLFETWECL